MLQNLHTEIALWDRIASGDREAYTALYKAYHPRLFNYGRKFIDHTELIEDSIQEVLVRIWLDRAKLSAIRNIRSYVFVSFRNSLMKALAARNKNARLPGGEDPSFSIEVSIDQVMINREQIYERQINLKHAVDRLTGRQKEAIFFMFYENMSYEEVAHILHISKKATYKLMARALTELKAIYIQQDALYTSPFFFLICFLPLLLQMAAF